MLIDIQIDIQIENIPGSGVSDQELRCVVVATLAKAILDCRKVPARTRIKLIKSTIKRDGHERTAEIRYYSHDPEDHLIVVSSRGRTAEQIITSVFHELTHLIRTVNRINKNGLMTEERENAEDMLASKIAVEWIAAVLVSDLRKELRSLSEYGTPIQPDRGKSEMVCTDNPGERVQLPV